jgi:hypothetical protein
MNCKSSLRYDGTNRKEIEKVGKLFPNNGTTIFILALHVETIILSDSSKFMISSN